MLKRCRKTPNLKAQLELKVREGNLKKVFEACESEVNECCKKKSG